MVWVDVTLAAGWSLFWLVWLVSAFNVKHREPGSRGRLWSRLIGLRIAAVLVVLLVVRGHIVKLNSGLTAGPVVQAIGVALFLLGLALALWARVYIGRNWGTPMSRALDPDLVTAGPYGYIRHPIYSGILLAGVGTALAANVFALVIVAAAGVYFAYSATVEERDMLRRFPDSYPQYKARTHMLVPYLL